MYSTPGKSGFGRTVGPWHRQSLAMPFEVRRLLLKHIVTICTNFGGHRVGLTREQTGLCLLVIESLRY